MSGEMSLVDVLSVRVAEPEKTVNRQLFENSPSSQILAEQYADMPEAFHNPQTPNLVIHHEKAQHRLVLLLKLRGMTNREIATEMEMSEGWVSQITRQPWFQERLVLALADAEGEVLDQIVKVEAKNSLFTLVNLRDAAKSEDVRAKCAIEILNRHLGKPVQRTENQTNVFHVSAKIEDLDRQLKEVEEAERQLMDGGASTARRAAGELSSAAGETPIIDLEKVKAE